MYICILSRFLFQQDGVRDTIDDSELLSSQDAETTQEWLFQLSSSQLDDLENLPDNADLPDLPDECGSIPEGNCDIEQGEVFELVLLIIYFMASVYNTSEILATNFVKTTGCYVEVKSRKRSHPES